MDSKIKNLRHEINKSLAEYNLLKSQYESLCLEIKQKEKHVKDLMKARWVIAEVAKNTQRKFKEYVEIMITSAICAVYEHRDYKFLFNFEIKRNKSECTMMVQEGGYEPEIPKDDQGGGMSDVISIALRPILWNLSKNKSRNVFILDEPLKFLGGGELLYRAINFLKRISHELNFQLIINTHEDEIIEEADRAWTVEHNGEYSVVSQEE